MTTSTILTAALLEVRAYLAREVQREDIRNEAAWEAGSDHEEHAAAEALDRLDSALRQIRDTGGAPKVDRNSAYAVSRPSMAA